MAQSIRRPPAVSRAFVLRNCKPSKTVSITRLKLLCFSSVREAIWQTRSLLETLARELACPKNPGRLNIYSHQTMIHQKHCS